VCDPLFSSTHENMTTIQFADGSAVTDAIADVRNDATETNWTLVTVFFCFWCVCVCSEEPEGETGESKNRMPFRKANIGWGAKQNRPSTRITSPAG